VFVAQLDLRALPKIRGLPLPKSGSLFFFYDADRQPWGFDPKDRGCARVIYSRSPLAENPLRAPHRDLDEEAHFRVALEAVPEFSVSRASGDFVRKWQPTTRERSSRLEHIQALEAPIHRVGGNPDEIQGDVFLGAQLAFNGIFCGDGQGYDRGCKTGLDQGAAGWRLLLQIDSDNRTAMHWGDSGRIYFLIRDDDLRRRDFDQVWLILQCT